MRWALAYFFICQQNTPTGIGEGVCPALTDSVKLNKAELDRVGGSTDTIR